MILASLEIRSQPFWAITGFALIVAVGIVDFLTGYEIAFSLFYLIPVSLVTWFAGKRLGIMAAIGSALVWYISDIASGHTYSHPAILFWNTGIRTSFFFIVTALLLALRKALEREKELARVDNLTGAVNARFFSYLAQREVGHSLRSKHPLTVAYIDLDNLKTINDQFGHNTGDKVLRTVANTASSQMRVTDVVARLGGDEFALLLPETGQEDAQVFISKIQRSLLSEMRKNDWPVTFSIGVLTCTEIPGTVGEMIKMSDDLMYSVKENGRNNVSYSVIRANHRLQPTGYAGG